MLTYRGILAAILGAVLITAGLGGCNSDHHHSQYGNAFPLHIGDVGPIAKDNPRQEPFACYTQNTDLGQPKVDNHDGVGLPVKDDSGKVIGYSANCLAPMQVDFYYRPAGQGPNDDLKKYDVDQPPNDVKQITIGGKQVPLIFRHEIGVINRFIYTVSMLSPAPENDPDGKIDTPDKKEWNGDLIFHFGGGIGIGHSQSEGFAHDFIDRPDSRRFNMALLKRGYAIVSSSGTVANTTYNLKLEGETAHMVKEQFIAAYGAPRYTFGLGDSGGSVQQFVYAQDHPKLLDALIPLQVFPDMITQVDPVGDCELLQYYFDVMDAQVNGTGLVDPKWVEWVNRQMISGFHGIDLGPSDPPFDSDLNKLRKLSSTADKGSDVCRQEWFGAVPQFMNPLFAQADSFSVLDPDVVKRTPFSFFDDLKPIFGTIPNTNLGRTTFDNVGVQYGLVPLRRGKITKKEFLDLNAHVGSVVPRQDMTAPVFPFKGDLPDDLSDLPAFLADIHKFDPWSAHNGTAIHHPDPSDVAPRFKGSVQAIQNAYKAGLVFVGNIDQPIVIIEPYLEPELNMHATREPFEVRHRLTNARGNADNLAIWMIGSGHDKDWTPFVLKAVEQETQWLNNHQRPADLETGCYDKSGNLIAEGKGVFKGEVGPNGRVLGGMQKASKPGACTQVYPIYSDARVQAGRKIGDHILKCALKPVTDAFGDGTYGNATFTAQQKARLKQIFPHGVCDWSKPGQGQPANLKWLPGGS